MIAVCLLTCNRFDYTRVTLESFARHNNLRTFELFHADDYSEDPRILPLVQSYGFRTIVRNRDRGGWLRTRTKLIRLAIKHGAEWILNLENDIETVRPFPWALFRYAQERVHNFECLRLYGRFKDREKRDVCLSRHKRTGLDVDWRPLRHAPELAQVGQIHWSAQPSVTRARCLWDLHRYGMDLAGMTVRPKRNVTHHIGLERTIPREPMRVAC